jgi:non-specific serine/threonine protein kinase
MPDAPEFYADVALTPHGLLLVEPGAEASLWLDAAMAKRVALAFEESPARGLLELATRELNSSLPAAAGWWREFGRRYLTLLCHLPDLEQAREIPALPFPPGSEWLPWLDSAPPMRGGEYLTLELLGGLWQELDQLVRAEIAAHERGAADWLRDSHPLWRMVGRVTFHLAENKKHPTHPFAFLATYASRISSQSRLQHLPLNRALQEYGSAHDKPALLNLLSPIQKAAENSPFVKGLVDSGRIFKAQPWTPAEAYKFLQSVPLCERAGIVIRVPDWWKGGRPSRPEVSVKIGQARAVRLGADSLLDFSADLTLEGEPLTEAEWQSLLAATEGLVLVRGKWVEVEADKLKEALTHWKRVEKMARQDGLTFFEGMRLLSGFAPGGGGAKEGGAAPAPREWAGLQAGDWLRQTLEELRDPGRIAAAEIPGLRASLRPYQQTGVSWLWFLARLGLGGCLADDMGLGKTLQVIALLLRRKAERLPSAAGGQPGAGAASLLVAPASLMANWRSELERFAPSLSYAIVHPSEMENPEAFLASPESRPDLAITTYGLVSRLKAFRERSWDLVILDEAQAIKNSGTRQTQAVKALKASGRFALTGTPVENRASDLWSIFDFLNPGLLGSAADFTRFVRAREKAEQPDFTPLRTLTRPYLLRRLKTDKRVIADLPEKTEMKAWCSLTKTQAGLYQKAVGELAEGLQAADGIQRKGLVLSFILRFKQICNHPSQWLGDGAYASPESGKFARLRELAEEIAERQEKALIFTQFREMTDPLSQFLTGIFGRPGLLLHGGTPVGERRKLVETFQRDDGPPFFILTVKAGGAGLNLTQAAQVIHFDRWWNPAVENQATDRAFRIGQKKNVLVHKFVCRGTIEERIDQVIESKQSLSDDLLSGGAERLVTEMSNDELLSFVSLDLKHAMGGAGES